LKPLLVSLLLLIFAAGCTQPAVQAAQEAPPATTPASPGASRPPASATVRPSATGTPTVTPTVTGTPTPTLTPTPEPAILTGAGDISICGQDGDDQTAALLESLPGEFFTAGDNSNESGEMWQYQRCFAPTWGRFLDRLHPAPGNHDYKVASGADYFTYFGAAAGTPGQGWYSYEYGGWHIVVLNSNCNDVACGKSSPQLEWLRADLAASQAQCTLAVWHHPRWSSGLAGSDGRMSAAYRILYEAGAEVVISGHDHNYERFTPLDPEGRPDPQRGIRQFVVGTGGAYHRPFLNILPESEAHAAGTFGLLKLSLSPDRYEWEFLPVAGADFSDSGSGTCH
jgi:hypothetical protein